MASEDTRWLLRRAARRDEGRLWWWLLGGFVLLALWNGRGASHEGRGLAPPAAAEQWRVFAGVVATVDDIAGDPGTFTGMVVTVSGEVARVLNRRAFTLGGRAFGGAELLVVSAAPLPDVVARPPGTPVVPGDIVQVTGPVRRFNQAEFQRESATVLERKLFSGWAGRPALLAQDVRISSRLFPAIPLPGAPDVPGAGAAASASGTATTPGSVPAGAASAAKPPAGTGAPTAPVSGRSPQPAGAPRAVAVPEAGDALPAPRELPMGYISTPAPEPPPVASEEVPSAPSEGAPPGNRPAAGNASPRPVARPMDGYRR